MPQQTMSEQEHQLQTSIAYMADSLLRVRYGWTCTNPGEEMRDDLVSLLDIAGQEVRSATQGDEGGCPDSRKDLQSVLRFHSGSIAALRDRYHQIIGSSQKPDYSRILDRLEAYVRAPRDACLPR